MRSVWCVPLVFGLMCCVGLSDGDDVEECGGMLTEPKGLIQTPDFPRPFPVPIKCKWIIDSSSQPEDTKIVVYFTQLLVSTGLTFTEYAYYEPDNVQFQLDPKLVHSVTESNVISVKWALTYMKYFVIDLELDRLEGNHLRVLDDLLDVYGFNITYEMRSGTDDPVRNDSCSVVGCSLAGNCYASLNYTSFWCSCFSGFTGSECSEGPLCRSDTNVCLNGATCRHVGMSAMCDCSPGFTGPSCDVPIVHTGCDGDVECSTPCKFDGDPENVCNCDTTGVRVSPDRTRYDLRFKLANLSSLSIQHPEQTLHNFIEKQVTRYFRSFSLSKMEDLEVLKITPIGEVIFHFFGSGHDSSRIRDALVRLTERGRLGEIVLIASYHNFRQDPPLSLESVRINHREPVVRQGDEFILTCKAQGSPHMVFNWYKDGIPVNDSKYLRSVWTGLLPLDSKDHYTALLGINDVDGLDEGRYTCHVTDWGIQECKSIYVEILEVPEVVVSPMSATVEKGSNINLNCISPNERVYEQIGYSWTRDRALFPMTPGVEVWEDLKPSGSILRVYNIQKSTTYTCSVHTSAASSSVSIKIDVVNRSSIALCKSQLSYDVMWTDAGPGSTAISDCPLRYLGTARRQCLISEPGVAQWQVPDFSNCVLDKVEKIAMHFQMLEKGFMKTTVESTLLALLKVVSEKNKFLPGEGEPIITLLSNIFTYNNETSSWPESINSTGHFFHVVSVILSHHQSIMNEHKLSELQFLLTNWALTYGEHMNSTVAHMVYENLVIDVMKVVKETHHSFYIPMITTSYPSWFTTKMVIHVVGESLSKNSTNRMAMISYKDVTKFLPGRLSQKLMDGSEVMYEIKSSVTSLALTGSVGIHIELELPIGWVDRHWNISCAVSSALGTDWDFHSCYHTYKQHNVSLCICQKLGVYGILATKLSSIDFGGENSLLQPSSVIVIGCICCLVQSVLSLVLLVVRWWHHKTCLMFLKLQFCTITAATMVVFIYANRSSPPQHTFTYIALIIETLIFMAISTHLCKLLIIYTEVVRLPNLKNLKETVFGVMAGVTLISVLCSLLAQSITDAPMKSWWLPYNSVIFSVVIICCTLTVILFILLYYNLNNRLKLLYCAQEPKTSRVIGRRIRLLRRTAVIYVGLMCVIVSSVLYGNIPTKMYQYLFSSACGILGFFILFCYVLNSETKWSWKSLKQFKIHSSKDQEFSSESDSNLFNFFTKQDAEVESDSAPPCIKNISAIPLKDAAPILEKSSKPKMVTFNSDPPPCELSILTEKDVDLEIYPNSPKKYNKEIVPSSPLEPDEPSEPPSDEGPSEARALCKPPDVTNVNPEMLTTRVCVELGVVKNPADPNAKQDIPTILMCSVDVEPGASLELNELKVSSGDTCIVGVKGVDKVDPSLPKLGELPIIEEEESPDDTDVLDRISHDLDYLLNRTLDAEIVPFQRHKKPNQSAEEPNSPQNTLLVAKTTL